MPDNLDVELFRFLVTAKQKTYAAQDVSEVRTKSMLPGSTQLEWTDGDWLYRDVYYGSTRFVGQETIFRGGKPIWSMCYSGGILPDANLDQAAHLYAVLKQALTQVTIDRPYRGPEKFVDGDYCYETTIDGNPNLFDGLEKISLDNKRQYELVFSGGQLS